MACRRKIQRPPESRRYCGGLRGEGDSELLDSPEAEGPIPAHEVTEGSAPGPHEVGLAGIPIIHHEADGGGHRSIERAGDAPLGGEGIGEPFRSSAGGGAIDENDEEGIGAFRPAETKVPAQAGGFHRSHPGTLDL